MRRIVGAHLVITFPVTEEATQHFLPDGLVCDGEPSAMMWFQQHHIYGDPAEVATLDAESSKYSEIVLKIPALLGTERGNFTTFGITDNLAFVANSRFHGIPQNPGRVFLTEHHPGDDDYDRPRENLDISFKYDGVGCYGLGTVRLRQSIEELPFVDGPNFGRRTFTDDVTNRVLLDDLYAGWAADFAMFDMWSGDVTMDLRAPEGSPLDLLQPTGPAVGFYFLSKFSGTQPTRRVALDYNDGSKV